MRMSAMDVVGVFDTRSLTWSNIQTEEEKNNVCVYMWTVRNECSLLFAIRMDFIMQFRLRNKYVEAFILPF